MQKNGGRKVLQRQTFRFPNKLGSRYELAKTYLEIGRFMEDSVNLRKAKDIFDDIGVNYEHELTEYSIPSE